MKEQRYLIHSSRNGENELTAKELYERVMADKQSDYNWIAPARELVRICKKTSFPADYAIDIKIAILNGFANIEHMENCGGDRYITDIADKEAVHYCYNSLWNSDKEEAMKARKRYLMEILKTASYFHVFSSMYQPGSTYKKIRENWCNSKFEEYISEENVDFKPLMETLQSSFTEVIQTAKANGEFEKDEKKENEFWQKFYTEMKNI